MGDEPLPCEGMTVSEALIDFVKEWEGCSLRVYSDAGGKATVGYGTTGPWVEALARMPSPEITQAEADGLLFRRLVDLEEQIADSVRVRLAQWEFDGLISLAYNIGIGALRTSTLLKHVNANRMSAAAEQFAVWNRADGKVNRGLVKRREAERAMFVDGDYTGRP